MNTWTWGTTIIEYHPHGPYGAVPVVWLGLNLECKAPLGTTGLAWQWAPSMGHGYPGTIRAARLMARRRYA